MPRSNDAKQWQPNASEQAQISRIAEYLLLTERCSAYLRTIDFAIVERLWAKVSAEFHRDPKKYPSMMACQSDIEGRNQFRSKCEALCFPPASKQPHCPEDYILMTFAAYAGLQSLTSQDLSGHRYAGEMSYRAHLIVTRELKGQAGYNAAVEFDKNLRDKPIDLLHETIRCVDKHPGNIVECTVVDCGTSVLNGDYFVLEDKNGRKKRVTSDELHDMRVD